MKCEICKKERRLWSLADGVCGVCADKAFKIGLKILKSGGEHEKSKIPCEVCGSSQCMTVDDKNAVLVHQDWCKFKKEEKKIIARIQEAVKELQGKT